MTANIQEYQDLYIKTAREKLMSMTSCLEEIREGRGPDALKDFHRYVHSLKSQSLLMGYTSIGSLARAIELGTKQVLETRGALSQNQLTLLDQLLSKMKTSVRTIAEGKPEYVFDSEIISVEKLIPQVTKP